MHIANPRNYCSLLAKKPNSCTHYRRTKCRLREEQNEAEVIHEMPGSSTKHNSTKARAVKKARAAIKPGPSSKNNIAEAAEKKKKEAHRMKAICLFFFVFDSSVKS